MNVECVIPIKCAFSDVQLNISKCKKRNAKLSDIYSKHIWE